MDRRKKAGIRFNEDLYINFIYDEDSNTIECYRNGVLINGGITPEELMHILENYATKAELSAVEAEIPDVTNLATKAELSAVEVEIPIVEYGNISIGDVLANSYTDVNVTFNKTFINQPEIVGCLKSASTSPEMGNVTVSIINESLTGFTIRVFNNGTARRTPVVRWIAIS